VVFITDEDDCSASNATLFDPSQQSLSDPLGPLTSFRCFEFGVTCDVNDRNAMGARGNCKPDEKSAYLHSVSGYIDFFEKVKGSADDVILVAIAGKLSPVSVGRDGQNPSLSPSCQTATGHAVPPIRLGKVVEHFGGEVYSICTDDFGPALRNIGERIVMKLKEPCVSRPLLSDTGHFVCTTGTDLGRGETCGANSLAQADCVMQEIDRNEQTLDIPRCSEALFYDAQTDSCAGECPCWRLRTSPKCGPSVGTSPYSIEILRNHTPSYGTIVAAFCSASTSKWGSKEMRELPRAEAP
jgi:hypothetical protein